MKKILGGICVLALLFGLAQAGNAYYEAWDSHFMRIEGRDAFNRPAQTNFYFEEPVFFKIYSMISPFGVCRWQPNSPLSAEISRDKSLKVPYAAVPFINNRLILPKISEKHLSKYLFPQTLTLLLLTAFILSYSPNLCSKDEPRFRVPVFLE
jgi:hypothetical protein